MKHFCVKFSDRSIVFLRYHTEKQIHKQLAVKTVPTRAVTAVGLGYRSANDAVDVDSNTDFSQ